MADQTKPDLNILIERIQGDIARQQDTIESLKSQGHRCPDAEQQLQLLKSDLALLHE